MSAFHVVLSVIAGCAVYVLIGWAAAVQRMPRAWRLQRETWSGWDDTYSMSARHNIREGVRNHTLAMFFGWPIAFPATFIYDYHKAHPLKNVIEQFIDRYDPEKVKPCPEPVEPKTLLLPREPSPASSPVTRVLSGLTKSGRSRQHSKS